MTFKTEIPSLTTATSPIIHFVSPKFSIHYCFQFLLETCIFPTEIENNSFCKIWGGGTKCIMGDVDVVNSGTEDQK